MLWWLALACAPSAKDGSPPTVVDSGEPSPMCLVLTEDKLGLGDLLKERSVTTTDPQGRTLSISHDDEGDGEIDRFAQWRYGVHGLLLYEERDRPGGALGRQDIYTYEGGLLVLHEIDRDGADGVVDSSNRYEYDALGRVVLDADYAHWDEPILVEYDRFEYNAQGLMVFDETGDPDGPRRWERYAYDVAGHLTLREADVDVDGVVDATRIYAYSARGDLVREESWDEDGLTNLWAYSYDERGRLLQFTRDRGGDGTVDYIETYSYDAQGEPLRRELDHDADGVADEIDSYVYEAGLLMQHDQDEDGDGQPELRFVYSYDSEGRVTRGDTLRMPSERYEHGVAFTYEEVLCSEP